MRPATWGSLLAACLAFAFLPVGLALMLLLVLNPQTASCLQPQDSTSSAGRLTQVIGDSITVGARSEFAQRFPGVPITAVGGMWWQWGLDKVHASSGDTVAYLLGTNGGVTSAQISGLLAAHPGVRFVLMTVSVPQPYEANSIAAVEASVRTQQTRVLVADWHKTVAQKPTLLGPDRIHPASAAGAQAFVDTIAAAIPATPASSGATLVSAVRPPYTQAQMTAAVARYDPQQAVALGAIAMAETGGSQFPTTNPTGEYHGPWAFQVASNAPRGVDMHRLDVDLDYAAQQAAILASTGITHGKWETWPAAATRFMHGSNANAAGATPPNAALANGNCTQVGPISSGSVVSAAGLTFPLATTEAALLRGGQTTTGAWERWCFTSLANCHHDYNAADLMAPTGTVVVSPVSGTVVNTHSGLGDACVYDNRGDRLSIDQSGNNAAWFMGHLLTGSLRVHTGDHVTAGEPLGVVGRAAEGQCTISHLHIQRNPAGDYGGQVHSLNIQPALVHLFQTLPK